MEEQGPQGPTGRRRPAQGSGHSGPEGGPFGAFDRGGLGVERTPPDPVADVEAGPPGGEQGEVVRGDRRQGVRWGVGEGVVGFGRELMDVGPEHPVAAHGGPDGGCHRTQVLAHHGHAGPGGLQDGDSPELLGPVADIGAIGGGHALGSPPQPVQAHHVVYPHHAGEAEGVAEDGDRVAVAVLADLLRVEGIDAPVLPGGLEAVGRRSDGGASGERGGMEPGVEAIGVGADR